MLLFDVIMMGGSCVHVWHQGCTESGSNEAWSLQVKTDQQVVDHILPKEFLNSLDSTTRNKFL